MKCCFVLLLQLPEAAFPGHLTLVQRMGKYLSSPFLFFFLKLLKKCFLLVGKWEVTALQVGCLHV